MSSCEHVIHVSLCNELTLLYSVDPSNRLSGSRIRIGRSYSSSCYSQSGLKGSHICLCSCVTFYQGFNPHCNSAMLKSILLKSILLKNNPGSIIGSAQHSRRQ
jgi:hypothetical protein